MAGLSAQAGQELMESGKYSDLTVTCKGKRWTLHKAIVLALSDYLKGAVSGNFDGGTTNGCDFKDEDPRILQSVFEWMYTGLYRPPLYTASLSEANGGNADCKCHSGGPCYFR